MFIEILGFHYFYGMKTPKVVLPYVLALETSTNIGAVALFEGDHLLGQIAYRKAKSHARLLSPMIQQILKDLQVDAKELAGVAVVKGPGSYTGLRVGVSTAKGLSMALDCPLMSFGSLEALAWQVKSLAAQLDAYICPMIDARRMEVYCALYDAEMQEIEPIHAKILDSESFSTILQDKKILFVGDGAAKTQEIFAHTPNAIVLAEVLASCSHMGPLLAQKYEQQAFEDLLRFEPFYLKDFVATKARNRLLD